MRPFDDLARLERVEALDKPAAAARDAVSRVLRNRRLKDALHGVWLGHPFHPGIAQMTLGSFVSAALLDGLDLVRGARPETTEGRRRESTVLILTGLALTPPTAASGWADYAEAHEDQQRTGIVHAATNITAVTLFGLALAIRARGGSGRVPSVLAGAVVGFGGLLGGHLSTRQALGANHAEEVAHIGPGDWVDVGRFDELPDEEPVRRLAGEVPVLVVRSGSDVSVLSDRCSHLSAPMSDGAVVNGNGSGPHVVCPWHGSEFRLSDGCVVHGPATAPLPRFETRVVEGDLEVRVVALPGVPAS